MNTARPLPAAAAVPEPSSPTPPVAPPITPFTPRLAVGLGGILVAAIMSGLSIRMTGLMLGDMRGQLGLAVAEGSWLKTVYVAADLVAMPVSVWLTVTFSMRLFHMGTVALFCLLSVIAVGVTDLPTLLVVRGLLGFTGGLLIPVLMGAALRFLPAPIRLHGLALYALTATFSPNIATWITGQWTDVVGHWQLLYWQNIPLGILAIVMVGWGIPQDPVRPERLKQANWAGFVYSAIGLGMLAVVLDQGSRLDWWRSDLIIWLTGAGILFTGLYLLTEWFHPAPFLKPQLLGRRNLWVAFLLLVMFLIVTLSSSLLPAQYLERIHDYRALQSAPLGLIVALPQLVLGSLVALLLYRRWVNARYVFISGLGLIAFACLLGSRITPEWMRDQFLIAQLLHMMGQPMSVVPLLFFSTSSVHPIEGPYVAGTVNTFRAFGVLLGSALIGHMMILRERFHTESLLDQLGANLHLPGVGSDLAGTVAAQAHILAIADSYLLLGGLALLMIPLVMYLHYVPPPKLGTAASPPVPASPPTLSVTPVP